MSDLAWAHWSNDLLVVAVLAYGLAMLGYAAEFAFAKRPGRRRPVAYAASSLAELDRAAADRAAAERAAALQVTAAVGVPAAVRAPAAVEVPRVPAYLRPPVAQPAADLRVATGGPFAEFLGRAAVVLTVVGFAAHLGSVVARGFAAGRVPWGNMYEFSCGITLAAVAAYLGVLVRLHVRWLGAFVMLPVVVTLGLAGTVLYSRAEPLQPALQSYWLKIHVVAAMLAWGAYMVGAVVTVLYLVKQRYERQLAAVPAGSAGAAVRSGGGIMRRLPDAESLDALSYRVIAFAFPIWTFAIIAGAIWAESAWGRYWGWDPKETWSFITWVIYAGYLHARATAGWRGRRAAGIALLGFGALTVDYYIINLVVTGLHSYAGLGS